MQIKLAKCFGFIILIGLLFSACPAQKEPQVSVEKLQQQAEAVLLEQQANIDQQWPQLVAKRQQCEATCRTNKCACLAGLVDEEQKMISLMLGVTALWNVWKAEDREFELQYHWLPGDARSENDLRELLLALPDAYHVQEQKLGLVLASHGQEDFISGDIAKVFQQLYAEKKIKDIQGYLKQVHLIFASADEVAMGLKPMDLPYFVLIQFPETEQDKAYCLIYASVFDQELFGEYPKKKFPWYGESITALIMVTKQNK